MMLFRELHGVEVSEQDDHFNILATGEGLVVIVRAFYTEGTSNTPLKDRFIKGPHGLITVKKTLSSGRHQNHKLRRLIIGTAKLGRVRMEIQQKEHFFEV